MLSVVTPTFRRPKEIAELLQNLTLQTRLPVEVIVVDGAPPTETDTERAVRALEGSLPYKVCYLRHPRGTAIQRNAGIDRATGSFVALIDDDVRLEPDFLRSVMDVFDRDCQCEIGGIVGYRTNQHFTHDSAQRWRWYRRLGLLTTFEPGRYDFQTGYPINANLQPPFSGVRQVDFMTTACAVWRRDVFESGLRFDPFFKDYGMLEDAHFALRAGRKWRLLQCGHARCEELSSTNGRVDRRRHGYKCVVNYYYVFKAVAGPLNFGQKVRFWRFQGAELFRIAASVIRRRRSSDIRELTGRLEGILRVARGTAFTR